jgi:hypothetical protein
MSLDTTKEPWNGIDVWQTLFKFGVKNFSPSFESFDFLMKCSLIDPMWFIRCAFRGVSFNRLAAVLETGIDVVPSDSVIYVSDFDKAWEYGRLLKVVLALDRDHLDRTYREVPADTPEDEITRLACKFPSIEKSRDGSRLWLSRMGEDDPRRTTSYEINYARWIPGDPKRALRAIFIFANERIDLQAAVKDAC